MNKKAFTLIELLVVIAIIAILAAILFPVFAQAKAAAKSASCLSNVKQFGVSSAMYTTSYDDVILPYAVMGGGINPNNPYFSGLYGGNNGVGTWPNPEPNTRIGAMWLTIIQPFMKSNAILYCPAFSLPALIKAFDDPNCDGLNSWYNYGAAFGVPCGYQTVTGTPPKGIIPLSYHGGFLAHYNTLFPTDSGPYGMVIASGGVEGYATCFYGSGNGTVGTVACPYFNFAASGTFESNSDVNNIGVTPPGGTAPWSVLTFQNLNQSILAHPEEALSYGDGFVDLIQRYDKSPLSNFERVGAAFGCEHIGRHIGGGGNFGFHDGHAKYVVGNPELVLKKDPTQPYFYVNTFSYDK